MLFFKRDIKKRTKKTAGMLATEVRIGDAPKPPFSINPLKNQKNPEINPLTGRTTKKPIS